MSDPLLDKSESIEQAYEGTQSNVQLVVHPMGFFVPNQLALSLVVALEQIR